MRQGGEPQGVQVVRQGEPTPYHCNFNRLYSTVTAFRLRPLQNLRFGRISKIASHNARIILKYFQALEKRMAKKWAKDEGFAKVSGCLKGSKAADYTPSVPPPARCTSAGSLKTCGQQVPTLRNAAWCVFTYAGQGIAEHIPHSRHPKQPPSKSVYTRPLLQIPYL